MSKQEHWESIYTANAPTKLSWYQQTPTVSLEFIRRVAPRPDAAILDVGGGASVLVDALISAGYTRVTVSDIAASALHHAQTRLGDASSQVEWRCADILAAPFTAASFDIWHDRAVFHFLTSAVDRGKYIDQVRGALRPNGYAIVATFAQDCPERCSGLQVMRYSADTLHAEFGAEFELIDTLREEHITPSGAVQAFQYCLCVYRPAAEAAA